MYKNELFGNASGSYTVKDTATALKRNAMATAFWAMTPGPKMLWQFGEVGYDYSINYCTNGTVDATGACRLTPKPVRWDYYSNANRKALYNVYASLLGLRNNPNYLKTFTTGAINYNLANAFKSLIVTSDSLSIVVVGNFDVVAQTGQVSFPLSGTWYSFLTSATHTATGNAENITLQPGEYYVYTNKNLNNYVITAINDPIISSTDMSLTVYPIPVQSNAIIQYYLSESSQVNIGLFDVNGRKVADLVNGYKFTGLQSFPLNQNGLNINTLSNGMYIIQMESKGKIKTAKIIINK
jgi:hypothetical protein